MKEVVFDWREEKLDIGSTYWRCEAGNGMWKLEVGHVPWERNENKYQFKVNNSGELYIATLEDAKKLAETKALALMEDAKKYSQKVYQALDLIDEDEKYKNLLEKYQDLLYVIR